MRDRGGALDQYIFPDRFLFITNFDDTGSFQYREEDIDRCDMFLQRFAGLERDHHWHCMERIVDLAGIDMMQVRTDTTFEASVIFIIISPSQGVCTEVKSAARI